jgi:ubiquinone/menaquinone biosynthesis C-methylase UbiE
MSGFRRPEFIARQASRPKGLVGRLLGRVMRSETAAVNDVAIEKLGLSVGDHVLEVGFGPGRAVAEMAGRVSEGLVEGVDVSETMLSAARGRNRDALVAGRVALRVGDADSLPYESGEFDKALSVHTVYFWTDLSRGLAEVARVLRPGGRLVLAFRPQGDPANDSFPSSVYTFPALDAIEDALTESGFGTVTSEVRDMQGHSIAFVVAGKPAPGR